MDCFRMEGTHVYLWPIHIDMWQKPSQFHKVIILQLNFLNFCFNFKNKQCLTQCSLTILVKTVGIDPYNLNSGVREVCSAPFCHSGTKADRRSPSMASLGVNTQPAVVKREGSGRLLWSRQGGDSYSPDQDLIPWLYLIVRETGNWSLCAKVKKKQA